MERMNKQPLFLPRGKHKTVASIALCILFWVAQSLGGQESSSESPDILFERFEKAQEAAKEIEFQNFVNSYIQLVKKGESRKTWDDSIARFLAPDRRSTIIAKLAEEGVFSRLQTTCVELNRKEKLAGWVAERANAAESLFLCLNPESASALVPLDRAERLAEAYRYFPSKPAADARETALNSSGDRLRLFRFRLYRYLDESNPSFFTSLRLRTERLFLRGAGTWAYEYETARDVLLENILGLGRAAGTLPVFDSDMLKSENDTPTLLSFGKYSSFLYRSKTAFVFFKTTCNYCETELKAIDRYIKTKEASGLPIPKIAAIAIPSGLPEMFDRLEPFEKKLGIDLPLFKMGQSEIAHAYDVRYVPYTILFDEKGLPIAQISFSSPLNLVKKIEWLLDGFMSDRLPIGQAMEKAADSLILPQTTPLTPPREEAKGSAGSIDGQPVPHTDSERDILMELFSDPSCGSCEDFLTQDIPSVERSSGRGVTVKAWDVMNPKSMDTLSAKLAERGIGLVSFPVAIIGEGVYQGLPEIRRGLTEAVRASRSTAPGNGTKEAASSTSYSTSSPENSAIPNLAAIPVFFAGLADGVNPCAFSTLLFLISMLSIAGRSRRDIAFIGLVYISTVFASYFAIGVGLLSSVRALSSFPEVARAIRIILSAALLILAALSVRDAILDLKGKRKEMSLVLPTRYRERIHSIIRTNIRFRSLVAGSAATAFLVSVFELACTGQVYFPVIGWLVRSGDTAKGLTFLGLYNLGFILPLVGVFGLAWAGISLKPVSDWFSKRIWLAKLALAFIFVLFFILTLLL